MKKAKEILVKLVTQCEISRMADKDRGYMKSQHQFYNTALSDLFSLIQEKKPKKKSMPEISDCSTEYRLAMYREQAEKYRIYNLGLDKYDAVIKEILEVK